MNDNQIRLIIFISSLLLFYLLEFKISYRERSLKRGERFLGNIGLIGISTILTKLLVPISVIQVALYSQKSGYGLLTLIDFPLWIEIILSILLFDLFIYFQHRLTHKVPLLWRLHRVHHTDLDLDATSALRFHPLEIIFSIFYKSIFVFILGLAPISIIINEIILSTMAIFNHSNIKIHPAIEKYLRLILVTPQMHLVHHSHKREESDMNFGFNFSFWDRILGTYKDKLDNDSLIGQSYYREKADHKLLSLLSLPFKKLEKES